MSFMDLLAHAGGPKQQANLSNIRIVRESVTKNEPRVTFFDFVAFTKAGQPESNLPNLRAGDTIIVDELPHDPSDNKSSCCANQHKIQSTFLVRLAPPRDVMRSTVSRVSSIFFRQRTVQLARPIFKKC